MRLVVARLVIASTSLLAGCTTTLSYKYDAGTDGGGGGPDGSVDGSGSAEGSAVEGGLDASGACSGSQFCEDFEKVGLVLQPRFDLIPRTGGSAKYDIVPLVPSGHGMSVAADADFGGYASPALAFTRSGTPPSIQITCTVRLTKARKATLLTITDGTASIRLHVRKTDVLVEGQPLVNGVIPTDARPVVLTAVFAGDTSTTLTGSVDGSTFNQPSLPALGTSVRIQFAQERDPDNSMEFPTEAVFDDIVIR